MIFRVGEENYGLPVTAVNSIIRYEEPTPVPRAPQAVLGVVNLRGRVIPVVDLHKRFKGEAFQVSSASRIVVADGAVGAVGLAVDAANEVMSIEESELRPVPDGVLAPETQRAFKGVVERTGSLVIILDLDEAVPRAEYAAAVSESETGE